MINYIFLDNEFIKLNIYITIINLIEKENLKKKIMWICGLANDHPDKPEPM